MAHLVVKMKAWQFRDSRPWNRWEKVLFMVQVKYVWNASKIHFHTCNFKVIYSVIKKLWLLNSQSGYVLSKTLQFKLAQTNHWAETTLSVANFMILPVSSVFIYRILRHNITPFINLEPQKFADDSDVRDFVLRQ